MKREKKEKRTRLGRMKRTVSETAEALFGEPYLECHGWRRITVGGATRIGSMSKERVVVLLRRGRLVICGEDLICVSFRSGSLTVEGTIDSVGKWRQET